jgi:hypothetical protein
MANATGIPALAWAILWITMAIGILGLAMRLYVAGRKPQFQLDSPLDQIPAAFPTTIRGTHITCVSRSAIQIIDDPN